MISAERVDPAAVSLADAVDAVDAVELEDAAAMPSAVQPTSVDFQPIDGEMWTTHVMSPRRLPPIDFFHVLFPPATGPPQPKSPPDRRVSYRSAAQPPH
jgi:hypothetical protein